MLEIITASWMSQAVHAAAELRIADILAAGRKTSAEVAAAAASDSSSVHRLLQALCAIDICKESADGEFELTSLGQLLREDSPQSLRSWAMWWGEHLWPAWGKLAYSVRTGKSARALLKGTEGFKHLEDDPAAAATFNRALVELTRMNTDGIVGGFDFARFKTIVDVGGGYGELLTAILRANPSAEGVLFDLSHAIDEARRRFAEIGLAERCKFVAGDFFQSVPAGGDAYVLKSVIHDWNDEKSEQILRSCAKAMKDESRLLIVEQVLPDRRESNPVHQSLSRSDLTMLVAHAAGERTETQFRALLQRSGFEVIRIVPAGVTFSVIEASHSLF
jgi:ubiquinone/menaquinone biosynthesis C-methylase UbiE